MTKKQYPSWRISLILILAIVLLAGCSQGTNPANGTNRPNPFNAATETNHPNPFGDVHFKIDTPLWPGMTHLTGIGPAGVAVSAVDITMDGEVLGGGVIGSDHKFDITLGQPLGAGRLIGIGLATEKKADTWLDLWSLHGENARAVPNMGDFFDTALTPEETPTP